MMMPDYIPLGPDDVIREGDEFLSLNEDWIPVCESIGFTPRHPDFDKLQFRRPSPTKEDVGLRDVENALDALVRDLDRYTRYALTDADAGNFRAAKYQAESILAEVTRMLFQFDAGSQTALLSPHSSDVTQEEGE